MASVFITLMLVAATPPGVIHWVPFTPGMPLPEGVIVLERRGQVPVLLGRSPLVPGDHHPGAVVGNVCFIPQKGTVENPSAFEIAVGPAPTWVRGDWQRATIVGRQGRWDLYLCRAPVRVGGTDAGWVYGKAYRDGPHASRAYVAFDGREIELLENFELLALPAGDK